MLKYQKRFVSRILVLLLALLFLAGCSQKEPAGTESQATSQAAVEETTAGNKIVNEPLTLTYFVELEGTKQAPVFSDLSKSNLYKELEKRTGITIKFVHPTSGQATDQLNLMILSGDYPDIIENMDYPGGTLKAYEDGIIVRISDYMNELPNLSKVLSEHPKWDKELKDDAKNIFAFPFIRGDEAMVWTSGPILRKDWLDKLGLSVPETMDDWYTVLKAFREKDPNGNGKKDEIPFTYVNAESYMLRVFSGAYNLVDVDWCVENGKVDFGPYKPAYKDYLTTLNKWYAEGLLDPDFAAQDWDTQDAKIFGGTAGAWIGGIIGMGETESVAKEKIPGFELVAAPYAVLNKGEVNKCKGTGTLWESVVISAKNEHLKETLKWLDYGYSEEGNMLYNFGIEGESYAMENGYPKYTDLITKNPNGLPMSQAMSLYMKSHLSGPFVQRIEYLEQVLSNDNQRDALALWGKAESSMSYSGSRTTEENTIFQPIKVNCETYMQEMRIKFIMGEADLSKFDEYITKLKDMKMEEANAIKQAGYDRYLAR